MTATKSQNKTGRWALQVCYALAFLLLFLVCGMAWYVGHFWIRVESIPVVEDPLDVEEFLNTSPHQPEESINWDETLRLMAVLREADEMVFDGKSEDVADAERFLGITEPTIERLGQLACRIPAPVQSPLRWDPEFERKNIVPMARGSTRALESRSKLLAERGRHAEAGECLITIIRLSRHHSYKQPLLPYLVAVATESIGIEGLREWLASPGLEAEDIEAVRSVLHDLDPPPQALSELIKSELLTWVITPDELKTLRRPISFDGPAQTRLGEWAKTLEIHSLEMNRATRVSRLYLTGLLAHCDLPLTRRPVPCAGLGPADGSLPLDGDKLRQLVEREYAGLRIAWEQVYKADSRMAARRAATELSLALCAWQRRHGSYPENLEDLVPRYFDALPFDPYSGKSFGYGHTTEPRGDPRVNRTVLASGQYFIYSVSYDGVDDHGLKDANTDLYPGDWIFALPMISAEEFPRIN